MLVLNWFVIGFLPRVQFFNLGWSKQKNLKYYMLIKNKNKRFPKSEGSNEPPEHYVMPTLSLAMNK